MRKFKRAMGILLSTAMVSAMVTLPITASAAEEGDWGYEVSDGKAKVTYYDGSDTVITVPSTLRGYPVTSIGDYFLNWQKAQSITQVTVPASVTHIGLNAFGDMHSEIDYESTARDPRLEESRGTVIIEGTPEVSTSSFDGGTNVSMPNSTANVTIRSRRGVTTGYDEDFFMGEFLVAEVSGYTPAEGNILVYHWDMDTYDEQYSGAMDTTDTCTREQAISPGGKILRSPYAMLGSDPSYVSVRVYEVSESDYLASKSSYGDYVDNYQAYYKLVGTSRIYTVRSLYDWSGDVDALSNEAFAAQLYGLTAYIGVGEELPISVLLGRAGVGHVYQCVNIYGASEPETENGVVSLSDAQHSIHITDYDDDYVDFTVTGNKAGIETIKYNITTTTYSCAYHGKFDLTDQEIEIHVISTSSTVHTITLYDVLPTTVVRCIDTGAEITADATGTVTFTGLDPDTLYGFEFFSSQENNILNPHGIIYERTKPIGGTPTENFSTGIRLIGNNQGSYEDHSSPLGDRYGKKDNGALGIITTITSHLEGNSTISTIKWDITTTDNAYTSEDFNDERANQSGSFTKLGSNFANMTLAENSSVAVILLIDEIYDLDANVTVTVE